MIIQHNIMAVNAHRQFTSNNSQVGKALEKLSSGFKINRAGDDAAGLAISEKMRAQIKGLERAQANAQDGISLVQTAEGALTEVHSMLTRMVELATQSSNGTYKNEVDRDALQSEVESLKSEIDRISQATNFNGINLIDGSLGGGATTGSAAGAKTISFSSITATMTEQKSANTTKVTVKTVGTTDTLAVNYVDANGVEKTMSFNPDNAAITAGAITDAEFLKNFAVTLSNSTAGAEELTFTAKDLGTGGATIKSVSRTTAGGALSDLATATTNGSDSQVSINTDTPAVGQAITIGGKTYEFVTKSGDSVKDSKSGNIAVGLNGGNNQAAAAAALVTALKANGVTTARAEGAAAAGRVIIDNTNEIKIASSMPEVISGTVGASVRDTVAVKGEYTSGITVSNSSTAAAKYTASFEYIKDGKTIKASVEYTGSTTAADVVSDFKKAFESNSQLNDLFEVKMDAANNLSLVAKTAGTDGARLIAASNNLSTAAAPTATNVGITTVAKDAGRDIVIDNTKIKAGETMTVGGKTFQFVSSNSDLKDGNIGVVLGSDNATTAKNLAAAMKTQGFAVTADGDKISFSNKTAGTGIGGLSLQIGDTAEDFNNVTVSVADMSIKGLGLTEINIGEAPGAKKAIDVIKAAINTVSTNRANMGALQNRLEHTINNLGVTTENMTAAESRVRDVDMAKQMMDFTKLNVLSQASQAMLAQANQQPQGVLQLLR